MEDKLREYIDDIFGAITPTRKAVELKEEMLQNLQDKYRDLISDGKPPEAAFNIAVAGIGDVSGLLAELEAEASYVVPDRHEMEIARQRTAMFTSIAVMVIILSFLPMLILALLNNRYFVIIGLPTMLVAIACGAGLLVYSKMTTPRFPYDNDSVVGQFREWQSASVNRKSLRRTISGVMWPMLVALYALISFSSGSWHITWIIFLFGAAAEVLVNFFLTLKK